MSGKIIKIIGYVVFGITVLVGLLFVVLDVPELNMQLAAIENMPQDVKILETHKIASNWSGFVMTYSYILLIVAAAAAIGFAVFNFIMNAIDNPKSAIKPLLAVVAVALIIIVSYYLGSDSMEGLGHIKEPITSTTVKWVDTSIYLMYGFLGLTILAVVYSSISRYWK